MLVVDLACEGGHRFEGWFASSADLDAQRAQGLLACPVCGTHDVARLPSAPHVHVPAEVAPVSTSAAPPVPQSDAAHAEEMLKSVQARVIEMLREVVSSTEDVGERFATEARDMHRGDAPERPIRGQATPEERQALREEGIEVMAVPAALLPKDVLH